MRGEEPAQAGGDGAGRAAGGAAVGRRREARGSRRPRRRRRPSPRRRRRPRPRRRRRRWPSRRSSAPQAAPSRRRPVAAKPEPPKPAPPPSAVAAKPEPPKPAPARQAVGGRSRSPRRRRPSLRWRRRRSRSRTSRRSSRPPRSRRASPPSRSRPPRRARSARSRARPPRASRIRSPPDAPKATAPSAPANRRRRSSSSSSAARSSTRATWPAAATNFNKAREYDARSSEAVAGLGEVAFEQGDYSGAAVHLKQALQAVAQPHALPRAPRPGLLQARQAQGRRRRVQEGAAHRPEQPGSAALARSRRAQAIGRLSGPRLLASAFRWRDVTVAL